MSSEIAILQTVASVKHNRHIHILSNTSATQKLQKPRQIQNHSFVLLTNQQQVEGVSKKFLHLKLLPLKTFTSDHT